jgi:hypothetical protein
MSAGFQGTTQCYIPEDKTLERNVPAASETLHDAVSPA